MDDIQPTIKGREVARRPVVRARLDTAHRGRLRSAAVVPYHAHGTSPAVISALKQGSAQAPAGIQSDKKSGRNRIRLLLRPGSGARTSVSGAWRAAKSVRPKDVPRAAKQLDDWLVNRHWRASYFAILVLAVIGFTGISIYQAHADAERYHLTAAERQLIGPASSQFAQLTYSATDRQYVFNQAAFTATKGNSAQVGPGSTPKTALYGAKLSTDDSQTLTVVDKTTQLSMSLTPLFSEMAGKAVTNAGQPQATPVESTRSEVDHVVAPVQGKPADRIYTVKGNGVKEDLLLTKAPGNGSVSFSYKLNLPDTLTARLDANGNLGIYSADPSLFGNITFGDSQSQQDVMKARQNSPRDNLVFVLPAPVIYESGSQATDPAGSQARFSLKGDILTITATGLSKLNYPATIDPSVVVTAASDFQLGGNNEGDISFASNQISTAGLTGGSVGTWAATSSFTTACDYSASVAYNGYLYLMGGWDGTNYYNDVQYAPISSSNGTLGTWQYTYNSASSSSFVGGFTTGRMQFAAVAYNGYLYITGGYDGTNSHSDVQYAPINSNGTIGTWAATTNFSTARSAHAAVAYNGYLYVLGGQGNGGTYLSDVQYAPFNADGTIGTWAETTSLPSARASFAAAAYNGYLYIAGGDGGGGNNINTVQYIPINANGSLGSTWTATTSFTSKRSGLSLVAYNGYMYVVGGGNNGSDYYATQYAPVYSDGTIGTWSTSSSFTNPDYGFGATTVAYNGYLYEIGSHDQNPLTDVQYVQINPAGTTGTYASTGNALAQGISDAASVAYNGYVYEIGGYGITSGTPLSTVYSASIGSNGVLGAWAANTSLSTALSDEAAVVYNGYLYVIGGYNTSYAAQKNIYYTTIGSTGTLGTTWSTATMPTTLASMTSVTYNGYLYVLGGNSGSGDVSTVSYAALGSNGAPGSWSTANALPEGSTGITLSSTVVAGGYIYEIGGLSGSALTTVSYAKINSNGSLGSWSSGASLPVALYRLTAVFSNGYIYALGGYNGTADASAVYYAPINGSSGGIGSWSTNTTLTKALDTATTVVARGYIYEIGGETGSTGSGNNGTAQTATYYAPLNNGGPGTASTWTTSSNSFTTARTAPNVFAYNNHLYILGGYTGSAYLNDVQFASISSNGSVGTWQYTYNSAATSYFVGGFSTGRVSFGAALYNGYLYVLGGWNGSQLQDVQYAPINADGTVGTWNSTTSLPAVNSDFGTAVYNGHLYEIGGTTGGGVTITTVRYASITSNGTIGSWTTTSSLNTARMDLVATEYDGYLYALGGSANGLSSDLTSVEYAPINSDGSVGTWQFTASFTNARDSFGIAAYNGYMYILGGENLSGTYFGDVQYASINSNGTLGTWAVSPNTFTNARYNLQAAAYNGYMYILGGKDSAGRLNDVQYAGLQSIPRVGQYSRLVDQTGNPGNGALSNWSLTTSLPAADNGAAAVAYNGYLYSLGGRTTSGGGIATVNYAPISNNGTVGSWTATSSLSTGVDAGTAVVNNGYVYVLGGENSSGTIIATVQYAPINASDGTLGTWSTTTALPETTASANTVVYNGYIYELGGQYNSTSVTSTVYYAPINASDGTLGTWSTTTALPAPTEVAAAVAYNGYLYEIGGWSGGYSAVVSYAPIGNNGALGAWTATTSLPVAADYLMASVANGHVYVLGGTNSSGSMVSTVESAPVNTDGTLGTWNATPSLVSANASGSAVAYNGYLYEIGGNSPSGYLSDVQYSRINGNDPLPESLLMHGTNAGNPGLGGTSGPGGIRVQYRLAGNACTAFGTSNTLSTGENDQIGTPFALSTATNGCSQNGNGRYLWLDFTLDDSQTATFPDVNGNHTTITDFTSVYNPNSGSRLRGGATFSDGSLQSLYTKP